MGGRPERLQLSGGHGARPQRPHGKAFRGAGHGPQGGGRQGVLSSRVYDPGGPDPRTRQGRQRVRDPVVPKPAHEIIHNDGILVCVLSLPVAAACAHARSGTYKDRPVMIACRKRVMGEAPLAGWMVVAFA